MATVEVSAPKDGAPVTSDPEPSPAPASAQPSPPRPATVREDQVANAVAFLTNPKVSTGLSLSCLLCNPNLLSSAPLLASPRLFHVFSRLCLQIWMPCLRCPGVRRARGVPASRRLRVIWDPAPDGDDFERSFDAAGGLCDYGGKDHLSGEEGSHVRRDRRSVPPRPPGAHRHILRSRSQPARPRFGRGDGSADWISSLRATVTAWAAGSSDQKSATVCCFSA